MVNDLCCLACSAPFGSRKQLSAHTSQCALNLSFTDQIFDRKRKLEKKKKKKDKRARRHESPEHIPDNVDNPEQPEVQDAMSIDENPCNYVRIIFYSCIILTLIIFSG
jgi:hypothetical protein